jgi:competence protein ComFC
MLKEWVEAGLGLFYPDSCQLCVRQRATSPEGYVCTTCRQEVQFIRPPFCGVCGRPFEGELTSPFECANCRGMEPHFDWARSSVAFGGPVQEVIHRYKYARALWFEPFLADLLIREAVPRLAGEHWDALIPVPLHPLREREREFNQSERLGRRLSAAAGIPLNTRLLKRVEPTRTQTQLSRAERLANVRDAFALRKGVSLQGWRCLLVDDVFTTGATTSACAKVLRRAGAEFVAVWTVARGG